MTDIDPRIETDHDATESFHAESGSGQKTATALDVSDHETSVTRTMTVSHVHDLLTANGKGSESDGDCPRELLSRDLALLSFLSSRPEERESREDKAREQESEDSLTFSRRGTCGENEGESTDSETREMEVCRERANSRSSSARRRRRRGSEPAHARQMPRGTPTALAGRG